LFPLTIFYFSPYLIIEATSVGIVSGSMIVFAFLFLSSLVFGKRAGCHYICWMTPFMSIGRKIRNILKYPSLRLR
jgi:hypothetical protein